MRKWVIVLRQARKYLMNCVKCAKEHRKLIVRYVAVGTVAWVASLGIQALLVETAQLQPEVAYVPQFFIVLAFYFWMLIKLVDPDGCYTWREYFHRVGVVKALQLVLGLALYKLFLIAGAGYILALAVTSLTLTIPFFIATMYGAFKKAPASEEAKA
jgi:putative flippase GtrA